MSQILRDKNDRDLKQKAGFEGDKNDLKSVISSYPSNLRLSEANKSYVKTETRRFNRKDNRNFF